MKDETKAPADCATSSLIIHNFGSASAAEPIARATGISSRTKSDRCFCRIAASQR